MNIRDIDEEELFNMVIHRDVGGANNDNDNEMPDQTQTDLKMRSITCSAITPSQWKIIGEHATLMKTAKFVKNMYETINSAFSCPICMDSIVPEEETTFIFTQCCHALCLGCTRTLVSGHGALKCPLCRDEMKTLTMFKVVSQAVSLVCCTLHPRDFNVARVELVSSNENHEYQVHNRESLMFCMCGVIPLINIICNDKRLAIFDKRQCNKRRKLDPTHLDDMLTSNDTLVKQLEKRIDDMENVYRDKKRRMENLTLEIRFLAESAKKDIDSIEFARKELEIIEKIKVHISGEKDKLTREYYQ